MFQIYFLVLVFAWPLMVMVASIDPNTFDRYESWRGVDLQNGASYKLTGDILLPTKVVNGICSKDNEEFYSSSRSKILRECGDVCDLDMDLRKMDGGEIVPWSGALKHIDCHSIWALSHEQEDLFEWPPPALPPCSFLNDFLMNDINVHLRWSLMLDREINKAHVKSSLETDHWTIKLINDMVQEAKEGILNIRYRSVENGTDAMSLVTEGLRYLDVVGKHVLVIGSTSPWVEACALAEGAAHVTTLEYREIKSEHPQITTMTMKDLRRAFLEGSSASTEDNSSPTFDIVVSHSSLEHSGLGRYGDNINPWGDLITAARAWCVTEPDGNLLLGVPFNYPLSPDGDSSNSNSIDGSGKTGDQFVYNAHRIYSEKRYPHLVANWELLWEGSEDFQKMRAFRKLPNQQQLYSSFRGQL